TLAKESLACPTPASAHRHQLRFLFARPSRPAICPLSLHDALPILPVGQSVRDEATKLGKRVQLELGGHNPLIVLADAKMDAAVRSEEHTSELQSRVDLVCRLLLEKKKTHRP